MANEKRLIDANALMKYINDEHSYAGLPMAAHILTMELLTYAPIVDAVEVSRLGKLGRLMIPYKGCPRGHMGARGCSDKDFRAIELDPIMDVDGNRWIPVLEEDLRDMKAGLNNAVEVVHGRWIKYVTCYRCSKCGHQVTSADNYCPNCGAKMDMEVRE